MCGRFALVAQPQDVEALFALIDAGDFPPRYNIAPTQPVLVVTAGPQPDPGSNLPARRAFLTRWGLIPGWTKDPAKMPLLINARGETAADKPAFKAAMRHRRALIPASGFYEWKDMGKGRPAQPFWMKPKGRTLVAFAALWETFAEPGGSEIDTAAIVTTQASEDISQIHHRMPVVIAPENFERWLDCRTQEPRDVADLMRTPEPELFEAIPVADLVNKVANTGPQLQARVEPASDAPRAKPAAAGQLSLF
jgi:putative SOS response-associated peptidase YedK